MVKAVCILTPVGLTTAGLSRPASPGILGLELRKVAGAGPPGGERTQHSLGRSLNKVCGSPCGQCEVLFTFTEVYLIYNKVLISSVQQNDSVIHKHIFFFIFFTIMVYYRMLSIAPCAT